MSRVDRRVSDPRQHFRRDKYQSRQDDQEREHVHLGEASPPGRERHPYSAGCNHGFDAHVAEPSPAAIARIRPHGDRGAKREDKNQARARAYHRGALLRFLFGAALRFALHLLHSRGWLGRKPVELPLDFL